MLCNYWWNYNLYLTSQGPRDGGWWGIEESNAITSWLRERKCKICQKGYQGICHKMILRWDGYSHTFNQFFRTVTIGLLSISFCGDYPTCSIMKHCQDAQQRMAMLLIYLLVSWIRQDCMRSRVFPMWLGMFASQLVTPLHVHVCGGVACADVFLETLFVPLREWCARLSRFQRNSFWCSTHVL